MSVDGIQICVDGVADAMVAVRPHRANPAIATPNRWITLPIFFMYMATSRRRKSCVVRKEASAVPSVMDPVDVLR
jgi:hypothetical protein